MARKRKRKFWRVLAGIATGGASEVARSKRLRKAVLTGGASEIVKSRAGQALLTGGASEITRSSFNLLRFGKLRGRNLKR